MQRLSPGKLGLGLGVVMLFFVIAVHSGHAQEWTPMASGVINDLNDIDCVDERTCFVVGGAPFIGGAGVVLKTADGGVIWSSQSIPTANPLRGISCPTALTCYAVGDDGTIIKTINGGATWTLQSVPVLSTFSGSARPWFWDIWASTPTTAVAVGNIGAVYRTVNGGATWTQIVLGLETRNLSSVFFIDENTGWLSGSGDALRKTTNGGATWFAQSTGSALGMDHLWSADGETVWAAGPFTFVYKSVNGGSSWNQISVPPAGGYDAIGFINSTTGWMGGNGSYLTTLDGGTTWTSTLGRVFYRSIECKGGVVCYMVGDDGTILRYGTPPPPPQPDLVVGTRSLTCPAADIDLEFAEYRYNVVVRNTGNGAAGSFAVRIQGLDSLGNLTGTPVNREIASLAAGASTTLTGQVNVGLLNPTAATVVNVRVTVDAFGQVAEANEENNTETFNQSCELRAPTSNQPDLTLRIDSVVCPASGDLHYIVIVTNRGGRATGPFLTKVESIDAQGNIVGSALVHSQDELLPTALVVFDNRDAVENFNPQRAATIRFRATADVIAQVGESDETNNIAIQEVSCASGNLLSNSPKDTPLPAPLDPEILESKQELTPQQKIDLRQFQIEKIQDFAPTVLLGVEKVIETKQVTRDVRKEELASQKISTIAKIELLRLATEKRGTVEGAMKAFIAYGVPDKDESLGKPIDKLGEGERAGVVNSFKEAFGKLPQTGKDWEDIMKIAVGRFPSQTNAVREKEAEAIFRRVYLRAPNRNQRNDNACVVVITYGLRPDVRNLNSEKAAITTFRKIFGKSPATASEWDTIRCIAYSGAKR